MSKPGASPDGVFDVTILGGGPTGLFGVFYAGMRHMRTLVIDALSELGGQLTALYPEKYVYDVGGFPKILARELAEGLIKQALQFHPEVGLEETGPQARACRPPVLLRADGGPPRTAPDAASLRPHAVGTAGLRPRARVVPLERADAQPATLPLPESVDARAVRRVAGRRWRPAPSAGPSA